MIEIIATRLQDAVCAQQGGADRIELVSALSEGGLTPSYGLIEQVVKSVNIPVNVMIRPHSAGFVYPLDEIELMRQDIHIAKQLGANGVVFGVLTPEYTLDITKLEQLLVACEGLDVTFHRAIDETKDLVAAVEQLQAYQQITTILTSGGLLAPIDQNEALLNDMVDKSGHIQLLLGGGLTKANISKVASAVNTSWFHFGSAAMTDGIVNPEKVRELKRLIGGN